MLEDLRKNECDMEELGILKSNDERSLTYEIDGGHIRRNRTGTGQAKSYV